MNEIPYQNLLPALGVVAIILFVTIVITRYAAAIGRFVLIIGIIAAVIAGASAIFSQGAAGVSQGAAVFKQAEVTNNAVKATQTLATGQTIAIVAGACGFGSLATFGTVGLIVAAVIYYRHQLNTQTTNRNLPARRQATPDPYYTQLSGGYHYPYPPTVQQPTVDVSQVNPKDWGW